MPEHSLSPARPRRSRALSLLVMSPVLLAGLVGCASLVPTPENIVEGVVEQVAEQSGEDLDVDVDATGDGVTLPADWPGLPVPEGRLFSAIKMGDSFSLSVEVDSEDAARDRGRTRRVRLRSAQRDRLRRAEGAGPEVRRVERRLRMDRLRRRDHGLVHDHARDFLIASGPETR